MLSSSIAYLNVNQNAVIYLNLKATQRADQNSNHAFISLKDLIAIKDRLSSAFLFIRGNRAAAAACRLGWLHELGF